MIKNILRGAVVAAALLSAAPIAKAQGSASLVGTWTIEYERGRRMENGEATPIMGTGTLSIVAQGDSMVATLTVPARPDGTVPPPATFGGRASGDAVVFIQQQTVNINMNGEESSRAVTMTWSLTANGDTLSGTLTRAMPGMPDMGGATPVKGTRKR